ncbi:MAG TPA: LLM class flavin-dependent oxidoreductase [Actinomycetota bacterium]|nr:LLM class flavin-dependent oxidoreductase [Actinomycetota bacterium]
MRVGLALPHYDFSFPDGRPLTWPRLLEAARRAESLGFDSLWISDHFFLDLGRYGGSSEPVGTVEPFTALAGLAASTERARLGVLVASAPFRHPAHVTKMATTIDLLSGGRFDLGVGAGWYEREFAAFGYPFPSTGDRFRMLEETVALIAALFGDGPVDFQGPNFTLSGAYNHPKPTQPSGPPVWIGGKGGDRLLRLVARHGSGWNLVWRATPEAHRERVQVLRRLAERGGRDPDTVGLSVGLYTLVGEDESDVRERFKALQRWTGGALDGQRLEDYAKDSLTGTPEQCLERLRRFAENGVEEVIVAAASRPFAVYDWSMVELFAGAVAPDARRL